MRTQEVKFIKRTEKYDPEQSKRVPVDEELGIRHANVTDVGIERSATVYGNVKQGQKEVHFMPYDFPPEGFTHVIIDDKTWQEITRRGEVRVTLILQEV